MLASASGGHGRAASRLSWSDGGHGLRMRGAARQLSCFLMFEELEACNLKHVCFVFKKDERQHLLLRLQTSLICSCSPSCRDCLRLWLWLCYYLLQNPPKNRTSNPYITLIRKNIYIMIMIIIVII